MRWPIDTDPWPARVVLHATLCLINEDGSNWAYSLIRDFGSIQVEGEQAGL